MLSERNNSRIFGGHWANSSTCLEDVRNIHVAETQASISVRRRPVFHRKPVSGFPLGHLSLG